jgi:hypothetical protein
MLNAQPYTNKVQPHVKREGARLYQCGHRAFQPDGATAHRSKVSLWWYEQHLPNFWKASVWPPSSPGLNAVDCRVRGEVTHNMKQDLNDWDEFKRGFQQLFDKVSKAFRQRS